jgi:hypothetical protein
MPAEFWRTGTMIAVAAATLGAALGVWAASLAAAAAAVPHALAWRRARRRQRGASRPGGTARTRRAQGADGAVPVQRSDRSAPLLDVHASVRLRGGR